MSKQVEWWKTAVIYHIYPRSFYDSNDDGIGDLPGITGKIDYLKKLGIDAIWLSPVYQSPQYDFGYDIADYYRIDACFGKFTDYKKLVKEAHENDIKVIMDMVLNHTSVEHRWFQESKSSAHNPKRDWYIWEKPRNGRRPNNWRNIFGGTAWQFDEQTNEYYYHSCFKQQPDLNWRNPEVWSEFKRIMKFWLDLGTDGFRFDVINLIVKDDKFRNNPVNLKGIFSKNKVFTRNRPRSLKIVNQVRKFLDQHGNKVSIGEIYTLPPGDPQLAANYLGDEKKGLHLTFDFSLLFKRWNAKKYARCIGNWYACIPESGWPTLVLSNHDLHRNYNRFFINVNAQKKAFVKAALLLTLKGTPVIYYGDEIGMKNVRIKRKFLQDPLGKKYWPFYSGRDKARTPMQWNGRQYAGFSLNKPWLPIDKNYKTCNIEHQLSNKRSLLNFYRKLIKLRKQYPALSQGEYKVLIAGKIGIYAYSRELKKQKIIVLTNFRNYSQHIEFGDIIVSKIILSTHRSNSAWNKPLQVKLNPYEVLILKGH